MAENLFRIIFDKRLGIEIFFISLHTDTNPHLLKELVT